MLKADRIPPTTATPFWRPERKAWAILLAAFIIFCMLASTTGYAIYRAAADPRAPSITARVVHPDVSYLQRAGLRREEMLVDGSQLAVGDRVRISPMGPPGIATRLQIDDAVVALWPASALEVEQRDRGTLRLRLQSGQAVMELPSGARTLFVAADPLAQDLELAAPGRYRIRMLATEGMTTARSEHNLAPGVEVATDQGVARMGEVAVEPGNRLVGHGTWRKENNRWELVRDGDFQAFSADEYRATLQMQTDAKRSDTWIVTQQPQSEGALSRNGLFYLLEECGVQGRGPDECRNVVRLARLGGNEKDSITAVAQAVNADVAAYEQVILEADVRVDEQSLSKGGADGSECPLFVRIDYANATQTGLQQYFCFWAFDRGSGEISSLPYIRSQWIAPKIWYHFQVDLHSQIPDLRAIEQVVFYSNGHDYDASVADVSLRAEGITTTRLR